MPDNLAIYRSLTRIRYFEETVLEQFARGVFHGTTHTYIGEEANAVGILSQLQPGDVIFSNHRGHGHFLAAGGDLRALFAELMGRSSGVCGGRGGSQHLHWGNFYSNGVQGGIAPLAVGMALAEKFKNSGALAVAFLGDGTLGEGVVYEACNMAALWKAPILFVVENNCIAQTTPIELALAGDIPARFQAFGIPAVSLDSSDVLEIWEATTPLLESIRRESAPRALVIQTCRFSPHSKGDDTRPAEAVERMRLERDPFRIHGQRLDEETRRKIEAEVKTEVDNAFQQALDDPYPQLAPDGIEASAA